MYRGRKTIVICKKCGKPIDADTKYCPYCGEKTDVLKSQNNKMSVIPGFRTNQTWKKIVAVIGYLVLGLTFIMMAIPYDYGNNRDKLIQSVSGIILVVLLIVIPLMIFTNFMGVRDKLPLFKKRKIFHTILGSLCLYLLIGFGITSMESITNNLYSEEYFRDMALVEQEEQEKGEEKQDKVTERVEEDNNVADEQTEINKQENMIEIVEVANPEEYIFPYSSQRKLTDEEISSVSRAERDLAVNEIYARHGRMFKDSQIMDYFNKKSWYSGTIIPEQFDESVFNDIERYNIDKLRQSTTINSNTDSAGYILYDYETNKDDLTAYVGKKVWVQGQIDQNYGGILTMSYPEGYDTICTVVYDAKQYEDMPTKSVYDANVIVRGTVTKINANTGAEIALDSIVFSAYDASFPQTATGYLPVASEGEVRRLNIDNYYQNIVVEGTVREMNDEEEHEYGNTHYGTIDLKNGGSIVFLYDVDDVPNHYYRVTSTQSVIGKKVRIYGFVTVNGVQYKPMIMTVRYVEPLE